MEEQNCYDILCDNRVYYKSSTKEWCKLPKNIAFAAGDLLLCKDTFIAQQSNCVAIKGHGLSESIYTKYPYADIYKPRANTGYRDTPGHVELRGNGQDKRYVCNMLAQYYTGTSRYKNDSAQLRESWFKACLQEMAAKYAKSGASFAFPWRISCGLAGGNLDHYIEMLVDFAAEIQDKDCTVNIYYKE